MPNIQVTDKASWDAACEAIFTGALNGAKKPVQGDPEMVLAELTVEFTEEPRFDATTGQLIMDTNDPKATGIRVNGRYAYCLRPRLAALQPDQLSPDAAPEPEAPAGEPVEPQAP